MTKLVEDVHDYGEFGLKSRRKDYLCKKFDLKIHTLFALMKNLLLVLCCLTSLCLFGQRHPSVPSRILHDNGTQRSLPKEQMPQWQEKLFITTDAPYYEAGDTLWFRGTLLRARNLSYVDKSNYITVEMINEQSEVVMRRKVLRDGLCFHHCLPLSPELRTGYYLLRAYTSWMRNYPEELFCYKPIMILNREMPLADDWQPAHQQALPATATANGLPQGAEIPSRDVSGKVRLTGGNLRERRDLITLEVEVFDPQTQAPLAGDFSISVLDARQVDCDYGRGYAPDIRQGLLGAQNLTTEAWQQYIDTLGEELRHPLEEHEWLSGRITSLMRRDRKDPTRISVSVIDTAGHSWGTAMLDTLGRFFIPDLNYPDGAKLEVRSLSWGGHPEYLFDAPLFPEAVHYYPDSLLQASHVRNLAATEDADQLLHLLRGQHVRLLHNIDVSGRKPRKSSFQAVGNRITLTQEYIRANYDTYQYDRALDLIAEMEEWDLNRYFKGHGLGEYDVIVIDSEGGEHSRWNTNMDWYLERLYVDDIDHFEFAQGVNSTGMAADNGTFNNYLYIYLNEGVEVSDIRKDQRRVHYSTFGYTPAQYFYLPRYFTDEQKSDPEPDLRKTLAWEPSFQTDGKGSVTLQFFNSDYPGPRLVVIEGVTFDGRPLHLETMLE